MKQYSADLRERALRQVDAGRPVGEVAQLFGVHRTTLLRWRRRRAQGELAPRPRPGRTPTIGRAQRPRLLAQVTAQPDATLAEHCAAWAQATGVAVSQATMCRTLGRLGWPLKKRA
jgi:transposase